MSDRLLHNRSHRSSDNSVYYYTKRTIDIVLALVALLTLLPLLVIIALLIKITCPGPILISQARIGARRRIVNTDGCKSVVWDSVEFQIYRFRTAAYDNKTVVSSFGSVLEWGNLDELPQLFNVLLGDMSIVGPHPVSIDEAAKHHDAYTERLTVLPGMTGLSQLENRAPADFDSMVALDIRYVRTCSIWLDLKIMLLTIPAAIFRGPS